MVGRSKRTEPEDRLQLPLIVILQFFLSSKIQGSVLTAERDAACREIMLVAEQGFGFLVNTVADSASGAARGGEQSDLVRGCARRARGYVYIAHLEPGQVRRRFRWALRYGYTAQDSTLTGILERLVRILEHR